MSGSFTIHYSFSHKMIQFSTTFMRQVKLNQIQSPQINVLVTTMASSLLLYSLSSQEPLAPRIFITDKLSTVSHFSSYQN